MRNFNLNAVTTQVRSSGFTVAQEEFFLDCQLEALSNNASGTGLTTSLENASNMPAAALAGLIGGLIGLLWGMYDHFFGKKKVLDVTMDKFESKFSSQESKRWDNAWDAYKERAKTSQHKTLDEVIKGLASSQKFRSIVDRNLFTMAIAGGKDMAFDLDLLSIVLNKAVRGLISALSHVNSQNVAAQNDAMYVIMADMKNAHSLIKSIAKIAEIEADFTDFFTTIGTVNSAFTILKGNTVNVSEAVYTKQATHVFGIGERGIKRLTGEPSNSQKDRFKGIGTVQQDALRALEKTQKALGSTEDTPEVIEFRKNAIKALTVLSKFYGNMLQYLTIEMKYRTELVDILISELNNAEGK